MRSVRPPSRREITLSALITLVASVAVGLMLVAMFGAVAVFVDIAMTDPAADASTPTGLPNWVYDVLLVVVLALVWPVACRAGRGTPGDGVMDLRALTTAGEPASATRVWVRAGLPLAVFGALVLLRHPGAGAAILVAMWAVALVRHDRRTAVDLLVGVVPHTTSSPKIATAHPWSSGVSGTRAS